MNLFRVPLWSVLVLLLETGPAINAHAQQTEWKRMGHFSPIEFAGLVGDSATLLSVSRTGNMRVLLTDVHSEEVITQWSGLPGVTEFESGNISHTASSILNTVATYPGSPLIAASFTTKHSYYSSWQGSPTHGSSFELAFWNYRNGKLDTLAGFRHAPSDLLFLDRDRLLMTHLSAIWMIDANTLSNTQLIQDARLVTVLGDSVVVARGASKLILYEVRAAQVIKEISIQLDSHFIAVPVLDHSRLAFTSGQVVKIIDLNTNAIAELPCGDSIVAMSYNESTRTLAVAGAQGNVLRWDLPDQVPVVWTNAEVTSVVAAGDGFIVGARNGYVLAVSHAEEIDTLSRLFSTSHSAVVHGDHVYTYHSGGILRVFNSAGETVREQMFPEPNGYLSPKGTKLLYVDAANSHVRVRNLQTSAIELDREVGWWFMFLGFSDDEREFAFRYRYDHDTEVYVVALPTQNEQRFTDTSFRYERRPETDRVFFDSTDRIIVAGSLWTGVIDRQNGSLTGAGPLHFNRQGIDHSNSRNELAYIFGDKLHLIDLGSFSVRETTPPLSSTISLPAVKYSADEREIFFGVHDSIAVLNLASMTWRIPYKGISYQSIVGQLNDKGLVTSGSMVIKLRLGPLLNIGSMEPLVSSLRPYPNPCTTLVTLAGCTEGSRIEILDIQGRIVMSLTGDNIIDVSVLPPGPYYASVCEPDGSCSSASFVKH